MIKCPIAIFVLFLLVSYIEKTSGTTIGEKLDGKVRTHNDPPIFSADYFERNAPSWSSILQPGVNSKNQINALEVGCFEGRASLWLLENLLLNEKSTLTCVDTFSGPVDYVEEYNITNLNSKYQYNTSPYRDKLIIVEDTSTNALKIPEVMQNRYQFVYIDAAHRARNAMEDAVLSFPLLDIGGVMVFDDYNIGSESMFTIDSPKLGIDAFLQFYAGSYKILYVSYQIWITKTAE